MRQLDDLGDLFASQQFRRSSKGRPLSTHVIGEREMHSIADYRCALIVNACFFMVGAAKARHVKLSSFPSRNTQSLMSRARTLVQLIRA